MNTNRIRTPRLALAPLALAPLALAAGAAIALASLAPVASAGQQSRSITTASSAGNTIRVESSNGEYTVTLNGKQISRGAITDKTWKTFDVTDESGETIAVISRDGTDFGISMTSTGEDEDDWNSFTINGNADDSPWPSAARMYTRAGKPPRTMLGVNLENPSEAMAAQLGINRETTTILTNISEGFPAEKAGLRRYDIVTEVDGQPASPEQLRKALREKNPGDTLSLKVLRAGERKDISVTLDAYDAQRMGTALNLAQPNAWGTGPSGGAGGFTFFGGPESEHAEKLAREMEELAKRLSERAGTAASKAGETQSRALEELNRQLEEMSRQLAERAEQFAQEQSNFGTTTPRAFRVFGRGTSGQGLPLVVPAPAAPPAPALPPGVPQMQGGFPAPTAPHASSPAEVESLKQRMDKIDERLAALTALLEKAVENRASAGSGSAKNQ